MSDDSASLPFAYARGAAMVAALNSGKREIKMHFKSLVVSGALGLATALMPVAASAQDADGGAPGANAVSPRVASKCRVIIGDANVAASELGFNTASNTFSDLGDTTVNFSIPGTRNRCVLVVFSAEPFTPGNELVHVRALRDGGVVGNPVEVQFGSGDGVFRKVTTAQFQFESVPPGKHTIVIQFRSQVNGQNVFIGRPVTSVFSE